MNSKKIIRLLFLLLFSFFPWMELSAVSYSLKEKFLHAHVGDYIVTKHDRTLSLLIVRSISEGILVLEEIAVPDTHLKELSKNVSLWVKNRAPGHTAWTFFEINLQSGTLLSCFSQSKQEWLHPQGGELFLSKLLALSFTFVEDEDRKKIGPPPQTGEIDTRRIWNPPLVFEGEKQNEPRFLVAQTRWGKEDSLLSSCLIHLYFNAKEPDFPFPYWIEIQSPHYAVKIPTINSGKNLQSPVKFEFIDKGEKKK